MSRPVRVIICDGHDQLRELVKAFLKNEPDIEVVGEATTGKQAVYRALLLHPDVVLMDLNVPELIVPLEPSRTILTMYPLEDLVGRCKEAGASGYILKDMMNSLLVEAIHTLGRGKSFFIPIKPV